MGNDTSSMAPKEAQNNGIPSHVLLKSIKRFGDFYTVNVKCVLLGCSGVGKTSFKSRFLWDEYREMEDTTMGAIRHIVTKIVGNIKLNIELWDTGSMERYSSFVPTYLKDCACAILLFDITDKESFLKAVNLAKNIKNATPEGTFIMLTGNKVDLESKREVRKDEALEICQPLKITFCEMSCKANYNIQKPLQELAAVVEKITSEVDIKDEQPVPKTPPTPIRPISKSVEELKVSGSGPPTANNSPTPGGPSPPNSTPNTATPSTPDQKRVSSLAVSRDEFESSPFAKRVNDEYLFACAERVAKTSLCVPVELTISKTQIILENIQDQSSGYSLFAPVEGLMRFLSRREYDFVEDDVTIRVSTDAHHSQRFDIWIKRKIDGLSVDAYVGDERDQYVEECLTLLSPLRDLIVKCLKERLPSFTKFEADRRSQMRSDFHRTYREHCKYLKVSPLRAIEDQILDSKETFTNLNLSKLCRDPKHLVAALEGMRWNSSIMYFDVSENQFGLAGLVPICRVAHSLQNLTELDLTDNKLGREGGVYVGGLISSLPSLRRLIVDKNGLADGAACIGATLSGNTSLTYLSMSQNNITSDAALSFARAFVINTTLKSLDLSCNDITEEAGLPLANALSCNSTLTRLCVLGNKELTENTILSLTIPKITHNQVTQDNGLDDLASSSGSSSEENRIGNAGTPQPVC